MDHDIAAWAATLHAALRAGDRGRAIRLAEDGLARGLRHPLALNLRAFKAEAAGRLAEAADDLAAACALSPEDAELHNTHGLILGRLDRRAQAVAAFARAVALAPGFAPAWRNLGLTQVAHGDVAGAWDSLQRAAALTLADAEPPGQLAVLAARRGDWGEAKRWGEAALALDPELPSAMRALAEVDMHGGRLDEAAARLEAWISRRPGGNTPRLVIGLLADVRDRQGRTAEAFALYSRAAADTRARAAPTFGGTGVPEALRRLRAQTPTSAGAGFTSTQALAPPRETCRHVFLMGFMRSGTTLIEQALAVRDDVVSLEEQEALTSGVQAYLNDADGLTRLAAASEAELDAHRRDYWARVRGFGAAPEGRVFVDKVPFNGVKLPLIARLFPHARVVFSLRDPRDVVLSCFKHRFGVNPFTYQLLDLTTAARFYADYMALVDAYLPTLPLPVLVYRHEDLVDDLNGHLNALCNFLGIGWHKAMRDVGARVREGRVSSPSAVQLRDGLSRRGLQGWRAYADPLEPIQPILKPWVSRFGYDDALGEAAGAQNNGGEARQSPPATFPFVSGRPIGLS